MFNHLLLSTNAHSSLTSHRFPPHDGSRMQMQPWRKQLSKSSDVLRTYLCSQKATDLLYPDEDAEDPVLPLLYFTLDEEEGIEELWRQNPMPSQPMQVKTTGWGAGGLGLGLG